VPAHTKYSRVSFYEGVMFSNIRL